MTDVNVKVKATDEASKVFKGLEGTLKSLTGEITKASQAFAALSAKGISSNQKLHKSAIDAALKEKYQMRDLAKESKIGIARIAQETRIKKINSDERIKLVTAEAKAHTESTKSINNQALARKNNASAAILENRAIRDARTGIIRSNEYRDTKGRLVRTTSTSRDAEGRESTQTQQHLNQRNSRMGGITWGGVGGAYAGYQGMRYGRNVFDTSMRMEGLGISLGTVGKEYFPNKSSEQIGRDEFKYLLESGNRLGTAVESSATPYMQMLASGKDLGLDKVRNIFEATTGSARLLGLSEDKMSHILYGVTQVMNKGKLQTQEYNLQINESMPGSREAFLKAFRVGTGKKDATQADFIQALEAGKISSNIMPLWADELNKLYKARIEATAQTSQQGKFNLAKNSELEMRKTSGEMLQPLFKATIDDITKVFKDINVILGNFGTSADKALRPIKWFMDLGNAGANLIIKAQDMNDDRKRRGEEDYQKLKRGVNFIGSSVRNVFNTNDNIPIPNFSSTQINKPLNQSIPQNGHITAEISLVGLPANATTQITKSGVIKSVELKTSRTRTGEATAQ